VMMVSLTNDSHHPMSLTQLTTDYVGGIPSRAEGLII
jgi:hypothetical protein